MLMYKILLANITNQRKISSEEILTKTASSLGISRDIFVLLFVIFSLLVALLGYFITKKILIRSKNVKQKKQYQEQKELEHFTKLEQEVKTIEPEEEILKVEEPKLLEKSKIEARIEAEGIITEAERKAYIIISQAEKEALIIKENIRLSSEKEIILFYSDLIANNLKTLEVEDNMQEDIIQKLLNQKIK